ncbi:MAG: phosphonoacetate hydrolase, partial [Pirellulaceae bacterium]|nr:phosphonoacetate hydrolase [Pirellulaceae bacterium]
NFSTTPLSVNGREYRPPAAPLVAICIDGCEDDYLATSISEGCMPTVEAMAANGYRGMARGALPSFTNVNNAAIATGAPPSVTGISGNFFLDPESGEEVMMNSADYLRVDTIFSAAARAGRKVAIVTAKEKLRDILSKDLQGIAFSAERASEARLETHGIDDVEALVGQPTPEIYSAEASLFVLRAGVALLENQMADFLYLSLTDYMQHKFAPDETESLDFHRAMDVELARLTGSGAVVAATADHGMNAKNLPDGSPNVIYLETMLSAQFGQGIKVICPITDPYVAHHGALGSLVMVHLPVEMNRAAIAGWILELPGVSEVHDRAAAAKQLELPADRIGDLTVLSDRHVVLGRTPADHDLQLLSGGLRSHGGRYEEMVPLLFSHPLNEQYLARAGEDPRNFDIFEFACNGVVL